MRGAGNHGAGAIPASFFHTLIFVLKSKAVG